jgi:G3E family GTPase
MALDIVVLSGFLGSGKTTLLIEWLRNYSDGNVGVIVNEVGDIDIDGETVLSADNSNPVTKLPSGCLCCSLRDSLVDTIFSLLRTQSESQGKTLDRIIIETSGLSLPGPIVASLADRELLELGLNIHIVSALDCVNGIKNAQASGEVAAQLVAAQRIILTKLDRVDAARIGQVGQYAAAINPMARVISEPDKTVAVKEAFFGGAGVTRQNLHEFFFFDKPMARNPHPRVKVYTRSLAAPLDWDAVARWLDDFGFYFGERLLRSKCILQLAGQTDPVVMQSVGHVYSQPTVLKGGQSADSKFVFIFRDVLEEEFETLFRQIDAVRI